MFGNLFDKTLFTILIDDVRGNLFDKTLVTILIGDVRDFHSSSLLWLNHRFVY